MVVVLKKRSELGKVLDFFRFKLFLLISYEEQLSVFTTYLFLFLIGLTVLGSHKKVPTTLHRIEKMAIAVTEFWRATPKANALSITPWPLGQVTFYPNLLS